MTLLAGTQFVTKVCGLISAFGDMNQVLECLGPIVVDVGSVIKLINAISKANQMKQLIKRIENDWRSIETAVEYSILSKYAENGRKFTLVYSGSPNSWNLSTPLRFSYKRDLIWRLSARRAFRHLALQVATLFHLYFESSQSQQLMDHSARVHENLRAKEIAAGFESSAFSNLTMDFFDGRHFKINKVLLCLIGQWPFQSREISTGILVLMILLAGTQFLTKVFGLISAYGDVSHVLECLGPIIADIGSVIKLLNAIFKADRMKQLMKRIENDWSSVEALPEYSILSAYAENGRKFTLVYSGVLYSSVTLFMAMPILPILLDKNGNVTEMSIIDNVEYYVNTEEYFYPIVLHAYVTICIVTTIVISLDSIFVVFVQHVCGLFSILGYRLENLTQGDGLCIELRPSLEDDEAFRNIVKCVRMHNEAIEFANHLESVYSTSFLLQAGFNMVIISITCVQAVTNLDDLHELVKQLALQVAILFHLFFESFQAQQLIDHSARVHENLMSTKWYRTSLRTRRIINFMIMRTRLPLKLTAGKVFPISMETFSLIVRTSMSYFTLLRSMQ
ncbi:hypothetical protein KM043_009004 [Ampulex compressa]|nr:hypothetical protein KM043_009004 [Ampulex compressa]